MTDGREELTEHLKALGELCIRVHGDGRKMISFSKPDVIGAYLLKAAELLEEGARPRGTRAERIRAGRR